VPCPFRLLARRRVGSGGSRCGVLFFPRVLVEFVGFVGGAYHPSRRARIIKVGLNTLSQYMELLVWEPQLAGEAGRRLTLGRPTP
jgi:hypothetical protein